MAVQALPRPRSLAGRLLAGWASRSQPGRRERVAAMVAKAREHVVTVAALAAADFGGFTVWHHGGWFVLCASLLAADFAIRG